LALPPNIRGRIWGNGMIFDTHLHLIDRSKLRYPWLIDTPELDSDWGYQAYDDVARRIGITGALHMEVDVDPADIDAETGLVAGLMAEPQSLICGAISAARPESAGFASWLEQVDTSVVKGLRRVLHVVPDSVSQPPIFAENLRRLGPLGLPFDICALARQLPLARALVDACPDTQFVLDHCGVPDIAGGGYAPWAAEISLLAQRPNLHAKISGITAYTGGEWNLATLRPYVEHIVTSFGWDRVVWGSDSPVCTLHSNLEQWVATTHALLSGTSEDEKAQLLHRNARRLWRI
jgi:predicted TIM-barrel fold metal-dependent hydrolase